LGHQNFSWQHIARYIHLFVPVAELATRFGIHPNQVGDWKRQAVEGLTDVFAGKTEHNDAAHEAQIKELHAKIGQLTVERDFLGKAFSR
jgi:transposase